MLKLKVQVLATEKVGALYGTAQSTHIRDLWLTGMTWGLVS